MPSFDGNTRSSAWPSPCAPRPPTVTGCVVIHDRRPGPKPRLTKTASLTSCALAAPPILAVRRTARVSCHIPSLPLRPQTRDFYCQFAASRRSVSCQSSVNTRDFVVGPDLIHLETTMMLYRPFWFYRHPLPLLRLYAVGENGVIREVRSVAAAPPEIELPSNQFPPESTHEVEGPARLYPISPHLLHLLNAPPRFRPPPPMDDVPGNPIRDPGYIPVPPGIRAVFTTPAVLHRGKSEMNNPPRTSQGSCAASWANPRPWPRGNHEEAGGRIRRPPGYQPNCLTAMASLNQCLDVFITR